MQARTTEGKRLLPALSTAMLLLSLVLIAPPPTPPAEAAVAPTMTIRTAPDASFMALPARSATGAGPWQAELGAAGLSLPARRLADSIIAHRDNDSTPFLVIDKLAARVFVFDAAGRLQDSSPVLLGAAHGDDSAPGIGERRIADIRPFERTTPAGRFVAEAGLNAQGEDIVWIDYEAAISMHRVRAANPKEHRLERLASATPEDHRISYGCINLPPEFFDAMVSPIFSRGRANVYILPELKTGREVFGWPEAIQAGVAPQGQTQTVSHVAG